MNTMFSTIILFFLSLFLLLPNLALSYTLEPILHSSKQDISSEDVTSSSFSLDSKKLESKTNTRAADLLKSVPGVEISQTGLVGGEASVFIRGAEGRHTLVLIDGVKVFDPTSIGRTINLSVLNTLDIDKIEVLKGSQSVLYGSDAIGGVINIITKKGSNKDSIKFSTGYFNEIATKNTVSLGDSILFLAAHYQEADNHSEALDGGEKDFNTTKGFTVNHSTEVGRFEFETIVKMSDSFSEVDGWDFSANQSKDDESAYGKDTHYFFKEGIVFNQTSNGKIQLDISYNKYDRKNKYFSISDYQSDKFDGTILEVELKKNYKQTNGDLLIGVNHIKETYIDNSISEKELSIYDVFLNKNVRAYDGNVFEVGVRGSHNKDFGGHGVYNLGWKRSLSKEFSIKVSNKTGYKAPSVYQQKAPATQWGPVGNEKLSPEKSNNYELALDYKDKNRFMGIAFFYNEVKNFIDFDKGYENVANLTSKGLELSAGKSEKKLGYGGSLTMINYAPTQGKEVQRRPNFALNSYLDYLISDQHQLNFSWNWKGRRFEYAGNDKLELSPYDVMDLDYIYTLESLKFITAVKNLFDREYENTKGYSVLGRSLQVTVNYSY